MESTARFLSASKSHLPLAEQVVAHYKTLNCVKKLRQLDSASQTWDQTTIENQSPPQSLAKESPEPSTKGSKKA